MLITVYIVSCFLVYRWVLLKPDFLGALKSVQCKSNLSYPVIFSLVYMEKLPLQKIQLNQESSLTDVWLKQDPPVCVLFIYVPLIMLTASHVSQKKHWHLIDGSHYTCLCSLVACLYDVLLQMHAAPPVYFYLYKGSHLWTGTPGRWVSVCILRLTKLHPYSWLIWHETVPEPDICGIFMVITCGERYIQHKRC